MNNTEKQLAVGCCLLPVAAVLPGMVNVELSELALKAYGLPPLSQVRLHREYRLGRMYDRSKAFMAIGVVGLLKLGEAMPNTFLHRAVENVPEITTAIAGVAAVCYAVSWLVCRNAEKTLEKV